MAITSANLANAIVKLVAVDTLPMLSGHLVMGNLVHRDFEPVVGNVGDVADVPTYSNDVGLQMVPIDLLHHAEATFQIPDVTKVIMVPDLLRLYMQPAMIALAEKVESDLLSLYSQFTANTPVGTGGSALTEDSVDAADTALFNAKVPQAQQKYLVVDGIAYGQLRQVSRVSEYRTADDAGLSALIEGSIGRIKDFYVFRSQFVKKTGFSPVTTNNIAFTKNALGLAIRRLPRPRHGIGAIAEYAELGDLGMCITMGYQPNTLAQQFTVGMLYGVGILRNDFGVQVRS